MMVTDCSVRLEARLRRDEGDWIVWCPSIDLYTQASSKGRALEAIREAVELWFESCIERGVLEEALREVGFGKLGDGESPPHGADRVAIRASEAELSGNARSKLSFSLERGRWGDYLEGLIPAYIAADQLEGLIPAYIAADQSRHNSSAST